jgi:hypothetical protein
MRGKLPNAGTRGEAARRTVLRPAGVLICAVVLLAAIARDLQAQRPSQDEVEAAYLYNFGKFVRWPAAGDRAPLEICIAGREEFEKSLDRLLTGEQIDHRPLQARLVDRPDAVDGCSILFIGAVDRARLDEYLKATAGKPVLTVSEAPDFLERGGMIQFVPVEDHVRFSVNLDAARRCRVGLSSELLKVAVEVTGKPSVPGERGGPQ